MKTDVFVATLNYQRLAELVKGVTQSSVGIEMAAVIGRAGRGKTTASTRITAQNAQTVYLRYEEGSIAELYRMLAFRVSGRDDLHSANSNTCKRIIKQELGSDRRVILVDEADRMNVRQLNVLRDVHDVCHVPVVLIGEEPLRAKLSAEHRLISRCRQTLEFEGVGATDLMVFYRGALDWQPPKECVPMLLNHARHDFRGVVRDALELERIAKVNGLSEITPQLVEMVCK